jgi:hypothetical protein
MRTLANMLVLLLGGCAILDPTSFSAMHGTSEVVIVVGPTGAGSTGLGAVLLGFGTVLPDHTDATRLVRASRYLVTSGPSSAYSVYPAFDEHVVDAQTTSGLLVSATAQPLYAGCVAGSLCGQGSSISAAATATWHADATTVRHDCVIVPAGLMLTDATTGAYHERFHLRCEPMASDVATLNVVAEHVGLGASAASLPAEHPLGVALFGAPGDQFGNGALYRLDDAPAIGFTRVDIPAPNGAAIGSSLVAAPLADGSILVATGGIGRPNDPVVVVASIDPSGGVVRHACLRGRGVGFGSALAMGDLDEDGVPDLAIGAATIVSDVVVTQPMEQPIRIWSGHALVAASAAGCEDPPSTTLAPTRSIDCATDNTSGFTCGGGTAGYTAYGISLAIGELNGDTHADLIIGAPLSGLRGQNAGALVVLAGGGTIDSLGVADHSVLTYSSLQAGAALGTHVATVPGVDRAEILASAPGNGRVALFFCSGLRGDRPEDFVGRSVTHGCVLGATPSTGLDAGVDASAPRDAGTMTMDASSDAGSDAGASDASMGGG